MKKSENRAFSAKPKVQIKETNQNKKNGKNSSNNSFVEESTNMEIFNNDSIRRSTTAANSRLTRAQNKILSRPSTASEFLNIKRIKTITNTQKILEIMPPEVYFDNIEANQPYQTILYVQNLSKIAKRIRVFQPKTNKFCVEYDPSIQLAAGMCGKLYINFESPFLDNFSDELIIEYEDNEKKQKIVVPIYARKPQPDIKFDDFLNLGFVKISKDVVRYVNFENVGKSLGKIKLLTDFTQQIKTEPSNFILQVGQKQRVKIIYNQKDSGIFRGLIEVQIEGQQNKGKIDVSATAVDYNKVILDEQQSQINNIDFGEIYFGQQKKSQGFLVNNTPKPQKFKVLMKLGVYNPSDEFVTLQTPAGQGREITEQIMCVKPNQGVIQPYSNIKLVFECNSVVKYEHAQQARKYAQNTQEQRVVAQEFNYYSIFQFDDEAEDPKEEPLVVSYIVKLTYPQLKLFKQIIKFGECNANDHRDNGFDIENRHSKLPVEIEVLRLPCFQILPKKFTLSPNQRSYLKASFNPNNVGVFNKEIELSLFNGLYIIPIQVVGVCKRFDDKKQKVRGIECVQEDFQTQDKYIQASVNKRIYEKKMGIGVPTFGKSTDVNLPKGFKNTGQEVDIKKLAEVQKIKENKEKYDNVLEEGRLSRLKQQKQQILQMRYTQMYDKLKKKGLVDQQEEEISLGPVDNVEMIQRGDPKIGAPVDLEFELGMMENNFEPKELDTPKHKDKLFVLKPIGDYEPIYDEISKIFDPNPDFVIRKLLPEKASNHKDIQDVHRELTGAELQNIQSGPVLIQFGEIYVNSRVQKVFSVKNDIKYTIKVQLFCDVPELKDTYQNVQIVRSGETARFQVVLFSEDVDEEFKARIKYVINDRHPFEFEVQAKITQVSLKISRNQIKFVFPDNSLNMEKQEQLIIENPGNDKGFFEWDNNSKLFQISPVKGFCLAKGQVVVTITYTPSCGTNSKESGVRYEEDKLVMRVLNGQGQQVKCIGVVNEPKCVLKQNTLDLNQILVCKEETRTFTIKNTSRISAIYKILTDLLPENLTILSNTQGKIPAEGQIDINVKYYCNVELKIETEIKIMIRGGKILVLPFTVETIIPKVYIKEPIFDFGKINALGNSAEGIMNLINESSIDAELVLDMRTEDENPDCPEGIDCLQIVSLDKNLEESVLQPVPTDQNEENITENQKNIQEGGANNGDENNSENKNNEQNSDDENDSLFSVEKTQKPQTSKLYYLTIKGGQTLKFQLTFTPKLVKKYSFELPLTLKRYGKLPQLSRTINCIGMKPKFLVDPQIVEFPRKIITSIENQFAIHTEIILSNPEKRCVNFRIDTSNIEKSQIFSIHPCSGRVDPGQTLRVRASFNPTYPENYEKVLPLYIDDPDVPQDQPNCYITLKGIAAYPKLLFDRREILMPVVPLNVESRCIFVIINDGYDTLKLKNKILDELGQMDIRCNFPEGLSMSVTQNKLKVEVVFSSKKPISFTTKIEFKDNNSNAYTIPVSGTADNCILTNFPFMQRNRGSYIFKIDTERSPVQLSEEKENPDEDESFEIDQNAKNNNNNNNAKNNKKNALKRKQSIRYVAASSFIQKDTIENNKEYIRSWLNYYVLSSQLQCFPESILEDNGEQMFELLQFLTGKAFSQFKQEFNPQMTRAEKIFAFYKQFDELIRHLKAEGALLNHIRPQYLLNHGDYHEYIKSLPKQEIEHVAPQYLRILSKDYYYLHMDAWITLFYQIIKLYYLIKVNSKLIKTVPNYNADKLTVPDFYINGSNVYSDKEGVLLRWLELNNDAIVNPGQSNSLKRIKNFESDLKDAWIVTNLITNYIGPSAQKHFQDMKNECVGEEDFYHNCERLSIALQDIKLSTQFNAIELALPSAREVLLFIIQLSQSLPYYLPKQQPIVFSCILGEEVVKTIEISNPTSKPISYWVTLEGSEDFKLDSEDNFRIESKGIYKYRVKFYARVSNVQNARITFTNKKESTVIASAIVFDLKGQITGRISEQIWNIDTPLYECKEFSIQIHNKFLNCEYGDFQILILHEYELKKPEEKKVEDPKDNKKKPQSLMQQLTKKKKDEEQPPPIEVEKVNFPSFFCRVERIKLKRNARFNLQMAFIPLIYESQKCFIIFNGPKVGEFQHEIRGRVDMPEEIIEIPEKPIQIYVDTPKIWNSNLSFKNNGWKNARKSLEQWLVEKNTTKFSKNNNINQLQAPQQMTVKQIFQKLNPKLVEFEVQIEQPVPTAIVLPKTIRLKNPKQPPATQNNIENNASNSDMGTKKLQTNNSDNKPQQSDHQTNSQQDSLNSQQPSTSSQGQVELESNVLPFNFQFKNPFKDYIAYVTIKNLQKTDVRKFKLVVTALPKPVKAQLEMVAPARECVYQEIPIINNTEKDWQIKISLTYNVPDTPFKYFFVNFPPKVPQLIERPGSFREFVVKKKTTGNIPICFYPEWICQTEAKLSITNPLTCDQFDYDLKGIGEEPLANDHIVITSLARQTTQKEIVIDNANCDQTITYTVTTDLIGAVGEPSITVPAKKKGIYLLKIHAVMSGQYTGSITFAKPDGTYIWWTVLLNTQSPSADRIIDLVTCVRKPVAFDIDLFNPSEETANFEVLMEGDGLQGEQYFSLKAKQKFKYELFFMPLKVQKQKGSVAFVSEKLGEIWYELNLIAEESGIIRLPALKAELGKTDQHEITLENPSNEDVHVQVQIQNPQNYEVYPENIVIPAYDQCQVNIVYRPNQLDKPQTCEIIFETQTIGKWVYLLNGQGLPPTNFEVTNITVGLNKDYSSLLNFKNPFKDPIQVRIFLDTRDAKVLDVIKLIKKNRENFITIPSQTIYQIPFTFQPKEIRCYQCNVVVSMNEKIQWRFPIQAITESFNTGILQTFQTKARVQINQEFSLHLPGLNKLQDESEQFKFELQNIPEDLKKIIDKSLRIQMIKDTLVSIEESLQFSVAFKPMKPFKCQIDFIIKRQSGGLWKFKIGLEATPPNEDDVIILSAVVGKFDQASFKLTNRFKTFATFKAYFTEESDFEFTVSPTTGLLEPYGKGGTHFLIKFNPLEYGKVRQGKLIIETDEMFWSYIVKGVLPKYKPPVIQESHINIVNRDYLDARNQKDKEKKNFLTNNIKQSSVLGQQLSPSQLSAKKPQGSSVLKGYFNYVPSLAGGEENVSVISYKTKTSKRAQTAKMITKNEL